MRAVRVAARPLVGLLAVLALAAGIADIGTAPAAASGGGGGCDPYVDGTVIPVPCSSGSGSGGSGGSGGGGAAATHDQLLHGPGARQVPGAESRVWPGRRPRARAGRCCSARAAQLAGRRRPSWSTTRPAPRRSRRSSCWPRPWASFRSPTSGRPPRRHAAATGSSDCPSGSGYRPAAGTPGP